MLEVNKEPNCVPILLDLMQNGVYLSYTRIAKGNEPVPRRMLMLHKDIEGHPRVWLQFSEWDFSPELSERIFTVSPARNAERFRFFEDTFAEESE